MIDMVKKSATTKNPLVERRVYTRSESNPKISAGIIENENGPDTKGSGPRKRIRSARAAGRGPRVIKKRSAQEAEKVCSWNERSASGENGPREVRVTIKGPLGVMMNDESQ